MSIIDALTIPLGVPVALIRDQLNRGVPPAAILAPEASLLAEFQDARGYAYAWGNINEARSSASLVWHFVPAELWEQTDELRRASHSTAVELIPALQPVVIATLRDRLRDDVLLVGCHPQSRRHPHVLFSVCLVHRPHERRARRWLAAVFLPSLLPEVLEHCRARVVEICGATLSPERPRCAMD